MTGLGGLVTADQLGPPLGFGGPALGPPLGHPSGPRRSPPSGCALIIPGPAKSSLFDHANQLFGGRGPGGGFETSSTCITYEVKKTRSTAALKRNNNREF